ncbi:MAG: trypsin-like peptidase domain-containing protein [Pararhodobacter sp.]
MIDRIVKAIMAAIAFVAFLPAAVAAQERYWVQMEAHATIRTAQEFARRYEQSIGNVAGFRLMGGWYALAAGPFNTPDEADTLRRDLMARRIIRSDAYVTDSSIYGEQFWPEDGTLPPPPAAAATPDPTPEAIPEPEITAPAPTDEPEAATETAAADDDTVEPPAAPAQIEIPEETLAEARRNEAGLTRDERADIQTALAWFGHYTMAIDAAFGPGTRRAMSAWQEAEGLDTTGVLTTRQRAQLLQDYADALARYGFAELTDDTAGVQITLPMNMIAFNRYESPFAHFDEANDSGMRVLLISQEGTQATLFGLYEIMQTLEVIPLEGRRERRGNGFLLTGQSDTARAHAVAQYRGGEIKGWVLLWEPRADEDAALVLSTMESSFRMLPGILPSATGASISAVSRRDLLAGLEVRRPVRSRSGFFVDAVGTVVTTAEAVAGCGRVTIDEAYDAEVRLLDEDNGIAVIAPRTSLVPLAFAQFAGSDPRLNTSVRLSGFSYQDTLTRPIITFGELADMQGLNGEETLRRLAIEVQPGDSGGPVFDANGAVMGMLLPRVEQPGRMLPEDVNFALSAQAVMQALERAQRRGALSRENATMPAEILTRVSADLTVLVSCWN